MCFANAGVFPNGSAMPLTLRQRLLYSNHLHRLERKISLCRENSIKIIKDLKGFGIAEDHLKNEYLIQKFVLGSKVYFVIIVGLEFLTLKHSIEQLSFCKRYNLKEEFFIFNDIRLVHQSID